MSAPSVILGERFQEALSLAVALHRFQAHRASGVPYASHLLAVASLVLEAGGTEDEAIAGLLHDAQEDAGRPIITWLIRERFGAAVADIVQACSEIDAKPKPPWLQRKAEYIGRMANEPASVQLVSSADKVHNVGTILTGFKTEGDAVWNRFSVGQDGTVWYYRSLADVFSRGPSPLAPMLEEAVSELEARVKISGREVQPSESWERPSGAGNKAAGLARALEIAREVHANQTDKSGAPYLLHPLRVMARMTSPTAMLAAILHDVVEDSANWTLARLRQEGFTEDVVSAVDAVTRRGGESYDDFIRRATADPIGREVKLADLEDNMDLRRLQALTERDIERLTRYHRVWRQATESGR